MKNRRPNSPWIRIPLKIIMWIIAGVVILAILVVLVFQIPAVQNFAAGKAVAFLRDKLDTKVELESVYLGFPKTVNIKGLFVADNSGDTLLYAGRVNVNMDIPALIRNKLIIRSVDLSGIVGNVYRNYHDTSFNYTFIIDAFAGDPQTEISDDTTGSMIIDFQKINLENIRLTFNDTLAGIKTALYFGKFNTRFTDFDLEKQVFKVENILLSNSSVSLLQTPPLLASSDTISSNNPPGKLPDIGFDNLNLENFSFLIQNTADGNSLNLRIPDFHVKAELIDLQNEKFTIESIKLSEADLRFEHSRPQHFDTIVEKAIKVEETNKYTATPKWEITVKELALTDNHLKYDNNDSASKAGGLDFNHLQLTSFQLKTGNIHLTPGVIDVTLEHLGFNERSGFRLVEFSSDIHYDTTNITLANLLIETPATTIRNHLAISFNSINQLSQEPEKAILDINLTESVIAVKDVLYIMPDLLEIPDIKINADEAIALTTNVSGTLNNLKISRFNLGNQRATDLSFTGEIKNLTNPDALYASINGLSMNTTKTDINSYLNQGLLPETISIPDNISVNLDFTGYLMNFNANALIESTFGNLEADVVMNPKEGNRPVNYNSNIRVDRFDLGRLLNNPDTLGAVSLQASINGRGFNPDSLNADVLATVSEAFYNGYTYKDLNVEGYVVNKSFHGEIWMHDNNLDFNYTGYLNANPDSLAILFDFKLNGADLKALNFSDQDLQVKGSIHSDLAKRYGPNPLGKINIYDVEIVNNGFSCPLDSLNIESFYDYDSSIINIRSEFLNATFRGDIVVQYLPASISNYLNNYFQFQDTLLYADTLKQQNFKFNIVVEDPNYICENLIPGLKKYLPLTIIGDYNSEQLALNLDADLPVLDYNGTVIDSLQLKINSDNQRLNYDFKVGELSNISLMIQQLSLNGNVSEDKIRYNLSAQKSDTFNVLKTGGYFSVDSSQYRLVMDEPFILNNTAWNLDPDNVITFSDKGINAQKVILTGGDQMVSILTQPGDNIPLKVSFENFDLMNVSIIIEKEQELARGRLNGNFILFDVNGVSAFTSEMNIDSLRFMESPIGNITLLADNSKVPERFDVDASLSGYGNSMTINGNYVVKDSIGLVDLKADIGYLNMATIEPFTFGQLSRLTGYLNGEIEIGGTTDTPDPKGYIQFNQVALSSSVTNTYLKVSDNRLTINNKRLNLNNLTLTDTLNNTAKVDGYVDFANLTSPRFDLRVQTDNFLAMNSPKRNEDLPVYGIVVLDSDIRLKGSPSNPVVNMSVKLNDETRLTYVMPEEALTTNESEGIVIFTDSLVPDNDTLKNDDEGMSTSLEGISLDASISFEPGAVLKMLVDPVAGDSLFVRGEGILNFSLEPGGQMNLTGNYNISSGGYNLTLNNLIKRQFEIAEGSTIMWNGDIMDANVDLNAIYTVRTSPMILLEDQVEGMDEAARNTYRNLLTFYVHLKMKGMLTKPEITFDIDQPDNEKGALNGSVNARLNELRTDESQLNKQVFALLTLNRFMGQDPFETGNAPLTVESATRASASKILTQQFSALSEKYIKGVDLDVGVQSYDDYSTGEGQGRTQLQLGVSKEFLNDRLMIQVGGNVELEGERAKSNDVSNIAGNLNVEYKLTPLGRYRLRAFRRIEYENPIEGELTNTGLGVSYSRDFRNLKQLFTSEKKRQERIRQREAKMENKEDSRQENTQTPIIKQ